MDPSALISSATRSLMLRMRGDLIAKRQRYLGRSYWVVKEPISLKYYRFQEEEYAILRLIDGRRSLDEIKQAFELEFRPQKVTLSDIHQFVAQLHRSGLVVSDAPGQGKSLYTVVDTKGRKTMRSFIVGCSLLAPSPGTSGWI